MNKIIERLTNFYSAIITEKEAILELLTSTETISSAIDEYSRCKTYLENILSKQKAYIPVDVSGLAVSYLPLNQPLYSLSLFPFTLSLTCNKVFYRPPEQLSSLHTQLYSLLFHDNSSVQICAISRTQFMQKYSSMADVVVYTGRLENVQDIQKQIRTDALLVYNGSALNPIIVSANADIEKAVDSVIQARLYNSGQDCMAPAAVFIHKKISSAFTSLLLSRLDQLYKRNGEWNKDAIGPMISAKCFEEDIEYLSTWNKQIIYGGSIFEGHFISPTVFFFSKYSGQAQNIMYAPYFCIYEYRDNSEITMYLSTQFATLYKGYISIFGEDIKDIIQSYKDIGLITLHNSTLFDYEDGNQEFGGYGLGCSFVATGESIQPHPILLLREVSEWRGKNAGVN